MLSAGITSLIESVKKIFDPTEPSYSTTTLVVIVVAIVVKLVLGQYVKHKGLQLKSDALIASGSDALFDAIITLATLLSAGIMLLWGVSLDGILGALISLSPRLSTNCWASAFPPSSPAKSRKRFQPTRVFMACTT